ncbi:MAG: hypothetical protein Q4G66_08790 [bacterium]|nr:hypothetical protein [bacterium]
MIFPVFCILRRIAVPQKQIGPTKFIKKLSRLSGNRIFSLEQGLQKMPATLDNGYFFYRK